ncbi:MAG: hypothetical protein ACFE94_08935 [Candidatus Hodarchaeota archaeon]
MQFLINIIACFVIAITLLFVGLLISYAFFIQIANTPDLTFLDYLGDFFSDDWGVSSSIYAGMPVTELVGSFRLFRTIEFLWVPILLGLIGGIALGRTSFKLRGTCKNKLIQLSIALGIAFPIFFLGMIFQYNSFIGGETHSSLMLFLGRFPAIGFKNPGYPDPAEITGFPILDARLSGQIYLALDRIEHLILPTVTITPAIIAFVAWQTRSNMERKLNEKSILSHTMKTMMIFNFIMIFYSLIEITFNLHLLSEVFLRGIMNSDPNVIRGVIFVFLIFLVVLTFISSIIYSIVSFLKFDRQHATEQNSPTLQNEESNPSEDNRGTTSRRDLKKFLKYSPLYLIKNPLILLGLIVTIGIVVCAIFAGPISGFTIEEANDVFADAWNLPSDAHVLGQTELGRDVFARVLYGLRGVLLYGFGAIIIGLAGGIIFGFISSLHRYVNRAIEVILIIIFIIPIIMVIPLFINIVGHIIDVITILSGILLIPLFTRGIANVPLSKKNILTSLKNIVIYIPLAFGIFVLIYESFGFLGFSDSFGLGKDVDIARSHLYDAPWATIWPGLFIFFIAFGSFVLHYGLKNLLVEANSFRTSIHRT